MAVAALVLVVAVPSRPILFGAVVVGLPTAPPAPPPPLPSPPATEAAWAALASEWAAALAGAREEGYAQARRLGRLLPPGEPPGGVQP